VNLQTRAIALGYSNKELLRHWQMFADYPTDDPDQKARMDALLRGQWPDEPRIGIPPILRVTPQMAMAEWQAMESFVKKSGRPGEDHHQAKLTEEDVREMRRLWAEGMALCRIAEAKNVTRQVARRVCLRQAWKHVA
jgi:hypothetical protein